MDKEKEQKGEFLNKKEEEKRNILIGMAWPYANWSLHLGHVAGLFSADVLARYHRMKGDEVLLVSGSDCHGTPIAVKARELGVPPESIAEKYHKEFKDNFAKMGFSFDYYGRTSDPRHYELVQKIFLNLYEQGLIYKKEELLTYCPQCEEFLPDRYVEGKCPHCGFEHARGDQCDQCGALLEPQELIDAKCKNCGAKPIQKSAEHFFLKLSAFEKQLKEWVAKQTTWRPNAFNFTKNFLEQGLKDRAITRDLDWGIPVPVEGYEQKKIYVWFEAVCGYFTDSVFWAEDRNEKGTEDTWWNNPKAWHYYVHGKDNIPFHTVIWPAILMGIKKNLPNQIVSSEYLTLEGQKISTSRNWAVWLPDYLERYKPDALRYYLIANGPETRDADFSWEKFIERNNNELVGTYGNLVNRLLNLAVKNFEGRLAETEIEAEILKKIETTFEKVGGLIEKAEMRAALQEIFELASFGNQYIDKNEPWRMIKTDKAEAERVLYQVLQVVGALGILLYPFLPFSSEEIFKILGWEEESLVWEFREARGEKALEVGEILFPKLDAKLAEEERARLGK